MKKMRDEDQQKEAFQGSGSQQHDEEFIIFAVCVSAEVADEDGHGYDEENDDDGDDDDVVVAAVGAHLLHHGLAAVLRSVAEDDVVVIFAGLAFYGAQVDGLLPF
jgi:hypothetical protein